MDEPVHHKFFVKVLLLEENDTWIAQGLEYDITGHGSTITAAITNFFMTLFGQAIVDSQHGEEPLANIKKAPFFYWQKYEAAQWEWRADIETLVARPECEIPPAFMIDAMKTNMRIYQ